MWRDLLRSLLSRIVDGARSGEVGDPFRFLDVRMIVDLHFFVDWGDLCLYGALVGCVYDSEVALGASVGRVHDEEKLGLVAAIRFGDFEVVDGVSWLVRWHVASEILECGIAGSSLLNFNTGLSVVNLEDEVSVGALHSEISELLGDVGGDFKGLHGFFYLKDYLFDLLTIKKAIM